LATKGCSTEELVEVDAELVRQLEELFREAGEAHHQA
jgi:hypothetical protein